MGRAVDRRAARVDPDGRGSSGSSGRVSPVSVSCSRSSRHARPRSSRAPAPRSTARRPPAVEVAGRGLDADGRRGASPRSAGDRARIASRASPSRGRAAEDREVDAAARQPPSASARRRSPAARGWRCPRGVRASAGNSRPRSPSPAAPSSASATRMQRDVAVGVAVEPRRPGDLDAAQTSGSPGPNGWRRGRSPVRRRGSGPASRRAARGEIGGHGHLEVAGSPGTTWTGILQASRSAASSVQARRRLGGTRRAPCAGCPAGRPGGSAPPRARCDRPSRRSRSPSTRLSVSVTGRTGIAAPCSAAALRRPPRRVPARPAGRAPSWTRTTRSPPASGASARARRTPAAATDSWRRSPPGDERRRPVGGQPRGRPRARDAAPPSRRRRSARRPARPAIAASVQARSGRPPSWASELVAAAHPRRAAGGHDDRVGRAAVGTGRSIESRLGEDHAAGDGLEHAGDGDVEVLVDVTARRPRPRPSSRRRGSRRPGPASLPSWITRTRSSSPGRSAGFTAFASELTLMTRTPWSSAMRLRLKSFVRTARLLRWASATSLASTSATSGHVVVDDLDRRRPAPSACGRGSRGRGGRGCGGASRSCRRCAAARRARTAAPPACRRGSRTRRCRRCGRR